MNKMFGNKEKERDFTKKDEKAEKSTESEGSDSPPIPKVRFTSNDEGFECVIRVRVEGKQDIIDCNQFIRDFLGGKDASRLLEYKITKARFSCHDQGKSSLLVQSDDANITGVGSAEKKTSDKS